MFKPPVLPVDVLQHLATELYAVSAMKDRETRNVVVSMVENELGHPLHSVRASNDWRDTLETLRSCAAVRSGLAALVRVVELLAPGEIATARFAAASAATGSLVPAMLTRRQRDDLFDVLDGTPAPSCLVEMFMAATAPLGALPARPDSFRALVTELEGRTSAFPLFSFVERIAAAEPDSTAALHEWIDANLAVLDTRRHAELRSLRAQLGGDPAVLGARTHVLVRLQPDELSDDLVTIQVWVFPDGRTPEINASSDTPVPTGSLPGWLDGMLAGLGSLTLTEKRPVIEFLVEPHEMNTPVDSWDGGLGSLGTRFPVVVRPATRPAHGRERWRRQWTTLGQSLENRLADLVLRVEDEPGFSARNLGDSVVRPCVVPAPGSGDAVDPLFRDLLDAGVPVMIWIRGAHGHAEQRTAIDKVLSGRELAGLPDSVRAFRALGWRAGEGDIRRDYVLFWDDPSRTPPERYDLTLPGRNEGKTE